MFAPLMCLVLFYFTASDGPFRVPSKKDRDNYQKTLLSTCSLVRTKKSPTSISLHNH